MSDIYLELAGAKVAPADRPYAQGIELMEGRTRPFVVERSWIGPMGHYWERWLLRRENGEVLAQGEPKQIFVKGFQSIRTFTDLVDSPLALEPGEYSLAFYVEDVFMGSVDVEVSAGSPAAA